MRTNLHHLIEHRAASHGQTPALSFKSKTLSYAELWQQVSGVARGLGRFGLEREQRVGVFLDKRLETVAAIFGISAAGGVFVPINPLLRPPQVGYILQDCGVRVLITSPERFDLLDETLKICPTITHIFLVDDGAAEFDPSHLGGWAVHRWSDLFDLNERAPQRADGIDLDIAAILYTSGSTGKPKGVVLSHRNLIVGAESHLGRTTVKF
jgi:acyl-CoA synthetase (AMP-forming)/AMP-acid ligase II